MQKDSEQELDNNDVKYEKYIILDDGEKIYYDILINADSVDYDCLRIKEGLSEPTLAKYTSASGKRVDIIQCNDALDENSVIKNGAPSYQSIEMMISVNAKPNSEVGKFLIDKARKDYPLEYMKEYYYHLSLASCLFALDKKSYPFSIRAGMLSRVLREFYPKAELLSKANDYEHLDNMPNRIQQIKLGKVSNGNPGRNKYDKETILEQISQMVIERVKGKINGEFSSEFIKKINQLGVGKYVNDNLKNKLLDIANEKDKNVNDNFVGDAANGVENLIQDITEIIRKNIGINDDVVQAESQPLYEMSDVETIISDRKLSDVQLIVNEIEENVKEEQPKKQQTRED